MAAAPRHGADAGVQLAALDTIRGSSEIAASSDCVISVKDGSAEWIKTRGWYVPASIRRSWIPASASQVPRCATRSATDQSGSR